MFCRLSLAPVDLIAEETVVAFTAGIAAYETQLARAATHLDLVAVFNRDDDLAVYGEANFVVGVTTVSVYGDVDLAVAGHGKRTHGELGRTDGREDKGVDLGVDNGAASRQRMSS